MDPLERAAALYCEAGRVMQAIHFQEILQPYGTPTFTGSYALNLMAFPDIDVEMPPMTVEQIFQACAAFAACPLVVQVVFERPNEPRLPGGLYFKPRIAFGNWGRPWKIDIWSIDEALIARQSAEMDDLHRRLTPKLREHILRYKVARLNSQNRTPQGSGYWIYRAVLVEGILPFDEIDQYLVEKGITLD